MNFKLKGDFWGHRYWSHLNRNIDLHPNVDYWNPYSNSEIILYGVLNLTLNFDLEGDLRGHWYRSHWNRYINLPQVTYLWQQCTCLFLVGWLPIAATAIKYSVGSPYSVGVKVRCQRTIDDEFRPQFSLNLRAISSDSNPCLSWNAHQNWSMYMDQNYR